MTRTAYLAPLASLALVASLAACKQETAAPPDPALATSGTAVDTPVQPSGPAGEPSGSATTASASVLTLEGLGALKFGQPVPKGSSWAERGAQASDECRVLSSPEYPKVYAIAEGGKIRRISVSEGAAVRTVEGIGPGSTRAQVDSAFPGFRESPHKYVDGGKYLTAPNAPSGDPAVRFEMSPQGKVTAMHFGTMPALGYVEACS
jgi:hypothetical protein